MKPTGYFDKHKKEIFEGNLVTLNGDRFIIQWIQGCNTHMAEELCEEDTMWDAHTVEIDSNMEIVGNT